VDNLIEKYHKTIDDLDREIPLVRQLVARPFEKEKELADMKTALASLEREIILKIQEKQLRERELFQNDQGPPEPEKEAGNETIVVQMTPVNASKKEGDIQTIHVAGLKTRKRSLRM
jgi:hypothetical protein